MGARKHNKILETDNGGEKLANPMVDEMAERCHS
jgi:hypothetical protein